MTLLSLWEIGVLAMVLGVAVSIIRHTLVYGISPMPSSHAVRRELIKHLPPLESGEIFELGSGFGTLAIPLAKHYPHLQVTGFEISPIPWSIAVIRTRLLGIKNLRFERSDFLKADLSPAKLFVSYLYPGGMTKIAECLQSLGPGQRYLLSHTFALPGHEPMANSRASDLYKSPIYLYQLPAPTTCTPSGEA
ncbi:MAG: methyltransferase [Deltaproteobacteria bacterium]|nr:methyltransferase [Deltaproteobacteria bacterium]MBT6434588.1 methyltransferase [Deltaproteobacteria bacterium]